MTHVHVGEGGAGVRNHMGFLSSLFFMCARAAIFLAKLFQVFL